MAAEVDEGDWQAVLHGHGQVVLYNPASRALTVTHTDEETLQPLAWEEYESEEVEGEEFCPYCHRPMAGAREPPAAYPAPDYFHLLAESTSSSRPRTPPGHESSGSRFAPETMADGYFDTFFKEEQKLGMGANGSVFLCQHVLDGNMLGHFAVKKIAVGTSHEYLVKILREVRLLETLRHQNIVTYHHSWLESCQFSAFGPPVPTLFVLMQWAEGGSLDDFIASRQGLSASGDPFPSNSPSRENLTEENLTKAQRIAAFRARNKAQSQKRSATMKAIHLLSADEILSLFGDITAGLAFLHDRAILHLDLKPGNVLLTWDPGALVPRAMLSDFGASKDMLQQNTNTRTGVTGTLEYTAPEVLRPDPTTGLFREMDTKSDLWSLGIILHKLIFFMTPYRDSDDFAQLQEEILRYMGFFLASDLLNSCIRRGLPAGLLHLLTTLLDIDPAERPTSERVLTYVRSEAAKYVRPTSPGHTRVPLRRGNSTPVNRDIPTPSPNNSLVMAPHPHPHTRGPYAPVPVRESSHQSVELESASSSQSTLQGAGDGDGDGGAESDDSPSTRVDVATASSLPRTPIVRNGQLHGAEELDGVAEDERGRPKLTLPIPESTTRSLPTALWAIAGPSSAASSRMGRRIRFVLLIAKIVTLSQYSAPINPTHIPTSTDSLLRTSLICLAAALAAADIWDLDSSTSPSSSASSFTTSVPAAPAPASHLPQSPALISSHTRSISRFPHTHVHAFVFSLALAFAHLVLLACLWYL